MLHVSCDDDRNKMLKPYKIGNYYVVADVDNTHERITRKPDGSSGWKFVQNIVWNNGTWEPEETAHRFFEEEAREVAWLELLVVIGESKKQALWEYKTCFEVCGLEDF